MKPTDSQVKNRRVRLADWITHPENPLTTRSIVNRVWQHHFGVGLAGNANNFGKMGKKPTHPELLDWLAQDFIDNGWSIKNLHRQIMLSQTYQRSSYHPQYNLVVQTDPQNQLLSHFQPRRLRAEELRDSMLAVSGELNREIGGLPVFPEINQEVALQPRHVMGRLLLLTNRQLHQANDIDELYMPIGREGYQIRCCQFLISLHLTLLVN